MKGKYITTSLMLAVLSGGKAGNSILVDETTAVTDNHAVIWSKTVAAAKLAMQQNAGRDELKMA